MFDQIFGNYLVSSGFLTADELDETIEAEKEVRVKLGLIAVTEKLMTQEQADEVNQLQAVMDKRFGDIAVKKGYLTDEQVGRLLKKQGNIYMVFVQTLIDKGFMTLDEIDTMLKHYQSMEGLSTSEMDNLVSGDIDRVIDLFLPENNELGKKHCGIAIRTILRLISSSAYVSKAYLVDEITADNFAMQPLGGDHEIFAGFAGMENALLMIANPFCGEEFDAVDLDALDAVGEFMNCINGLFATELSNNGVEVDMLPPQYYENPCRIRGNQYIIFPIHIKEQVLNFVLAIDSQVEVEQLQA
ncbi:MAG: chemotaxis protein CheX [Lachnospiraceae bacterium]|nr:chemotaxis protein CheX [Lachnospiraceae bacterium]